MVHYFTCVGWLVSSVVMLVMQTHSHPNVGLLSLEGRASGLTSHGSGVVTERSPFAHWKTNTAGVDHPRHVNWGFYLPTLHAAPNHDVSSGELERNGSRIS